ncbi:hypothetical protein [Planobispora rosea]|nr:hypothetical protein [Planobispora rosea]
MDPDTFRSDIGVDVYWRRRLAALIAVLVVVAVVAWACSSSEGPQDVQAAQVAQTTSPGPDPLLAALPTVTVTPTPPQNAASAPPSPAPTPRPAKPSRPSKRPGELCDNADLVLGLQADGEVYGAGALPGFILTLVNTGKVMCVADVGPRSLEIRITSGNDRVWSSSDCVSGETENLRKLERGIPHVQVLKWDRHRSAADCRAERLRARPGTYVAAVRATGMKSRKVVFHLR